jgi:L-rhamnose isomerase/sugar isomerase
MLDECHNIEGKMLSTIVAVMNCQEAYAKALCVPRGVLAELRQSGQVLLAHKLLTDAFRTDVRPLLAQVREEMGVPVDPVAAYLASGYEEKVRQERGVASTSGGFQ